MMIKWPILVSYIWLECDIGVPFSEVWADAVTFTCNLKGAKWLLCEQN